jgi:hypothetical protein
MGMYRWSLVLVLCGVAAALVVVGLSAHAGILWAGAVFVNGIPTVDRLPRMHLLQTISNPTPYLEL